MRRVGHQHAVAPCERQIGSERRALVAALFLHDLHQQNLPAADNVLNLVAAAQIHSALAECLHGIIATAAAARARRRIGIAAFAVIIVMPIIAVVIAFRITIGVIVAVVTARVIFRIGLGTKRGFFGGMLGFFAEQRVAILFGDLIIIGVDFAEGQEAMAIAAVIDKRRLKRRFNPCYLGEIDIAFELLTLSRFEIKLFNPGSLDDGNPGFFPVPSVDQHTHGH